MDLIHLSRAFLVGDWIGFESTDGKVLEVVIQLGAILAVCWFCRARLMQLLLGLLVLAWFAPAALRGETA